jgi:hypothetical protein
MSHHAVAVDGAFSRGARPSGLDIYRGADHPGTFLRGEACFYQGVLFQGQSYHDNYTCSFDRVPMPGGDGMNFSTEYLLPVARRCLQSCLIVPGIKCCHFLRSWC